MSQQGDYSGKYFGDYLGGSSGTIGVLVGSASITVSAAGQISTQAWADINARSVKRKKPAQKIGREYGDADEMRRQIALLRQIEAEDEVVLALVMAAVPLIGDTTWQRR